EVIPSRICGNQEDPYFVLFFSIIKRKVITHAPRSWLIDKPRQQPDGVRLAGNRVILKVILKKCPVVIVKWRRATPIQTSHHIPLIIRGTLVGLSIPHHSSPRSRDQRTMILQLKL